MNIEYVRNGDYYMARYLTRLTEALGQDNFAKFVALAQKANAV